jgi:hypothetical protein
LKQIKDGNVTIVYKNDINQAIKNWRKRLINYGALKTLRMRREHPGKGGRQRYKRRLSERRLKRRERRLLYGR